MCTCCFWSSAVTRSEFKTKICRFLFFYEGGRSSWALKESVQAPPHQTLSVGFGKVPVIHPDPSKVTRGDVGKPALVVKELGGTRGILAEASALLKVTSAGHRAALC